MDTGRCHLPKNINIIRNPVWFVSIPSDALWLVRGTGYIPEVNQLLCGMESFTAAYLDDVVIYSETWEQHCLHIRKVLQCLRENGLMVKPAKYQFGMSQCTYLGHVVGNGHVRPEADKMKAVCDFPIPTTKQQVQSYLGLTGY